MYYAFLARGEDDPQTRRNFEVAILAHRFGRFAEIRKFTLKALFDLRPRLTLGVLYGILLICAVVSGALTFAASKKPAAAFECTAVPDTKNVFVCQPK